LHNLPLLLPTKEKCVPTNYGDNLQVLREHIADESVEPICLDPILSPEAGRIVPLETATAAIACDIRVDAQYKK